jgi:hypothetical protein
MKLLLNMKHASNYRSASRGHLRQATATLVALLMTLTSVQRTPAAQAPSHKISAMNVDVIQNDTANTVNSVTVSSTLSINDMRVRPGSNRGDYNFQIGDIFTNNYLLGVPMVAISQNGRDNGELANEQKDYSAPAFDGGVNGMWASINNLQSDRGELNINCAIAYFRLTNYLCGWARNATGANGGTNNSFISSPGIVLGSQFKGISSGRSRVDLRSLGVYSTNSVATNTGVLLVNHAKNEGNYCSAQVNADGTWEVYVKDNFANNNSLEQDPTAFVYVPKTNTFVVSGRFGLDATGTNVVVYGFSGSSQAFSVTNIGAGQYRLTIPSGSPAAGVLIVSSESNGAGSTNFDNTVSYEANGNSWIIEHRDVGAFPPPLEACTNEAVASFVYIPAATAGFSVSPTNGLVTSEFGLTASFNVQLDLAPTNDVTIDVTSSNPAEGIVSTNSLTFNSTNWNIPQFVTVTGQDDAIADGNIAYTIILSPNSSGDTNYLGMNPPDVSIINVDDEQAGITVSPTSGLVTTEAGGTAAYSVFLNRLPTDDVTFAVTSGNTAEGTVSTNSLTFTPANWNIPQTITVTGVPDFRKDGNKTFTITNAVATSSDVSYNGINPADVSVLNVDIDNPAINYSANTITVAEAGTTNYSIVLATRPDSNVVVVVTSSSLSVATVSPVTNIFTPLDWNTPKIITVTGVDNLVTNGSTPFFITNTVSSTDPLYADFAGVKLIIGTRLDNEAQLILPSGECIYGLGMPAISIDGQARIEDVDAVNYNGGSLTVSLAANGDAGDRLEIRSVGSGPGQISVSGSDVSYEGNIIGTISGGLNLNPLVITLNSNSTLAAVQKLARSITFGTVTNNASLATRTATFVLNDGLVSVGAAKTIRVGALRMTQYQESADYGYGDYFGVGDIALSEVGADIPWPAGRTPAPQEGLLIDWPDGGTPNESQVLLRFDEFVGTNAWQVPSNSVVVSAELLVYVNNPGDGGRFFRMLIPWDSANDTWNTLGEGVQADGIEAEIVYNAQLGVEDGSGATGTGQIIIGVTKDVQAWVNGTNNYGWVMKGWPLMTDGTGFTASEYNDVSQRPRLRVKWLVPGYSEISYQQNINGYSNTFDVNLRQANPDVVDNLNNGISSDWNDAGNTNTTQSLLKFENIIGTGTNQIPPGSLIHAAVLDLFSTGSDAMGDGGSLHALLQSWTDSTSTWNSWVNGIQANGIEAAITPTFTMGNASLNPDVQGTLNQLDVTSDVQAWANGTLANNGWALLPWPNGSNAWISRSSKFVSLVDPLNPDAEHPRLRVFYTAGVFAVPAVIQTLTVSPIQVQVPFTGTAGLTYTVLRASSVTGPWNNVGSATVNGSGIATFNDNAPLSGGAFYRVVYP